MFKLWFTWMYASYTCKKNTDMTKMTLTVTMTVISDPVSDTVLLMPGK